MKKNICIVQKYIFFFSKLRNRYDGMSITVDQLEGVNNLCAH